MKQANSSKPKHSDRLDEEQRLLLILGNNIGITIEALHMTNLVGLCTDMWHFNELIVGSVLVSMTKV